MLQPLLTDVKRVIRRVTRNRFSEADLIQRYFGSRRGGSMLDVGAHFGESHAPYLQQGWRVVAFEPDPSNRARIPQGEGQKQLELLQCAVGERFVDAADFFASDESTGVSTLVPFIASHKPVCRVQVRTLDDVCAERGLTRCDFLKIDCEGAEYDILFGATEDSLRSVRRIAMEYHEGVTAYGRRDLVRFLEDRGFRVRTRPNPAHREIGFLFASREGLSDLPASPAPLQRTE
jgi:FkbM family methyltransferase